MSSNLTSPSLRCTFCTNSFKRKEHLDRHLRRHLGLKFFRCNLCARSFSRKDSLARHSAVHLGEGANPAPTSSVSTSQRRPRACSLCSKSKRRCSGGMPCDPCRHKGLSCHFPYDRTLHAAQASVEDQKFTDTSILRERVLNDVETLDQNPNSGFSRDEVFTQDELDSEGNYGFRDADVINHATMTRSEPVLPNIEGDLVSSNLPLIRRLHGGWFNANNETNTSDRDNNLLFTSMLQPNISWNSDNFPWASDSLEFRDNRVFDFSLESFGIGSASESADEKPSQVPTGVLQRSRATSYNSERFGNTKSAQGSLLPECDSFRLRQKINDIFPHFPEPQPSDDDVICAEDFYYESRVSPETYRSIQKFFEEQRQTEKTALPSLKIFYIFVQLYYEHFDVHFPMVHLSTLDNGKDAWILLLAMASIGSQYSQISNGEQYVICMRELLLRAVVKNLHRPEAPSIQLIQSLLLAQISLLFSGSMELVTRMQIETDLLVYFCSRLPDDYTMKQSAKVDIDTDTEHKWKNWVAKESHNRTLHCIFRLECLQVLLLDFPPTFHHHDLMAKLPSDEKLWRSRSWREWQAKSSLSHLDNHGADNGRLYKRDKRSMGSFARDMYTLILYVDEKLISTKPFASSVRMSFIAPSSAIVATNTSVITSSGSLEQIPVLSSLKSSIEDMFDYLFFDQPGAYARESSIDTFFHLISILRQVPLRHLYAFSRWRATVAEAEESKNYLQSWMESDPISARRCLWHAVTILNVMRSKQQHACHEPFTLMISILMIWSFDMLAKPCEFIDHESLKNTNNEQEPPTRIDHLKTVIDVERWANEGKNDRVLLTGIGILRGQESSRRLLMECRKILSSGTAWARLRAAISHGVSNVLQGKPPTHPDDP